MRSCENAYNSTMGLLNDCGMKYLNQWAAFEQLSSAGKGFEHLITKLKSTEQKSMITPLMIRHNVRTIIHCNLHKRR